MTKEDLQRDVESLKDIRAHIDDSIWLADTTAALDRAIEFARIRASMSDEQRAYLVEHCTNVAVDDEESASEDDSAWDGGPMGLCPSETADAHRKVARLMGGAT